VFLHIYAIKAHEIPISIRHQSDTQYYHPVLLQSFQSTFYIIILLVSVLSSDRPSDVQPSTEASRPPCVTLSSISSISFSVLCHSSSRDRY